MSKHAMRARRLAAQQADHTPAAASPAGARGLLPPPAAAAAPDRVLLDALERAVNDLDRLAADTAYTPEERRAFVRAARPMRAQFEELAARQFDANTAGYADAVATLGAVNAELTEVQGRIDDVPAFLGLLTRVAGVLDNVIRAAVPV